MTRTTRFILATFLSLCFLGGQAFAAPAERGVEWKHRTCRYNGANTNVNWSRWEVRATINCAVDRYPTSRSTVFHIAERESGLYHHAVNPTSGACGILQYYPASSFHTFWLSLARLNGVPAAPNCFNARSNILAGVKFMSNQGFGPWGY